MSDNTPLSAGVSDSPSPSFSHLSSTAPRSFAPGAAWSASPVQTVPALDATDADVRQVADFAGRVAPGVEDSLATTPRCFVGRSTTDSAASPSNAGSPAAALFASSVGPPPRPRRARRRLSGHSRISNHHGHRRAAWDRRHRVRSCVVATDHGRRSAGSLRRALGACSIVPASELRSERCASAYPHASSVQSPARRGCVARLYSIWRSLSRTG